MVMLWPMLSACGDVSVIVTTPVTELRDAPPAAITARTGDKVCTTDTFAGNAEVGVIGGWSQLKFRWNTRNEFNVGAGTGGRNSSGLRQALLYNFQLPLIPARNQMIFGNYIFRPRSDLLFSAEYRRLRTYEIIGSPDSAGQLGLAIGFLF